MLDNRENDNYKDELASIPRKGSGSTTTATKLYYHKLNLYEN